MKHNRRWILTLAFIFALASGLSTAKPTERMLYATPEINNEDKVRDLVAFLELLLNTLGSSTSTPRDKDVIITESYKKVFRDSKVQVEDDLAPGRSTITNKDVVAYLKDVDFFFEHVSFKFDIEKIEKGTNANGQTFFKVSARRTLEGTTISGTKIQNTIPRFIELNYDPVQDDLKVVSVYTNEFDEREALTQWWATLSLEWKKIFRERLNLPDSASLGDIRDIWSLHELDLSGNPLIVSLEPLGQLTSLRRLNLSHTAIGDLTPIRNLTDLVELDLSYSPVFDLSPLRYARKLRQLNISHTDVRSIAVLENMESLKSLQMQGLQVLDFSPLAQLDSAVSLNLKQTFVHDLSVIASLPRLAELDVSRTTVQDLTPLQNLTSLKHLNIDSTGVRSIAPLKTSRSLEVLSANYSFISDLTPLLSLTRLRRIYCDQTPIGKAAADAFMSQRRDVLVIYDSRDLQAWWQTLPDEWQTVLSQAASIPMTPGKEDLARTTNLDSINIGNNRAITTLEPLARLEKLRIVVAHNTGINDLSPLNNHRAIRFLDISDTEVTDLSPLSKFPALEVLRADRSAIASIEPLHGLKNLRELYVDRTSIHDVTAKEFLDRNPQSLIVYKTMHLDRWWQRLSPEWKNAFLTLLNGDTTREQMHRMVEQPVLRIEDIPVRDLEPLGEFVRLRELHLTGTRISEIPDLPALHSLRVLRVANSPLRQIGAIAGFRSLEALDISNTPVSDLRGVENLQELRSLNCAGTQVRKLDPLKSVYPLEVLDCSNTVVRQLDPVMYLSLRDLKAYNTKVSSREIDQFREQNPDCEIVYYR